MRDLVAEASASVAALEVAQVELEARMEVAAAAARVVVTSAGKEEAAVAAVAAVLGEAAAAARAVAVAAERVAVALVAGQALMEDVRREVWARRHP